MIVVNALAVQATTQHAPICRYRQCLANAAGLSLSSVRVTSQQAGSIMLGTTMTFPANTSQYSGLASSLRASLQSNPSSAFASDSSFLSQYGPVTFDALNSVGMQTGPFSSLAPSAEPVYVAQIEGSTDNPAAAQEGPSADGVLHPIAAANLARIEGYGTFIPVDGYSPPPPPLSPPPPPISPPPLGATAAPTVIAATPTPTPTESSSSVGD